MGRALLGALALLVGGACLLWGLRTAATIRASAGWPTTPGVVLASRVKPDSTRIRGGGYNRHYVADIRYAYDVAGRRHESDTFVFGEPRAFPDPAAAEREVAAYPAGRSITVFYDPSDPATSCLAPGVVPAGFGLLLGTSGVFALGGLALLAGGVCGVRRRGDGTP
jgi:hypothetical protein